MKTLLFDLDGTLVETIPLWIEANIQALAERNLTVKPDVFLKDYYQQGLHFDGILERAGGQATDTDAWYAARDARYVALLRKEATWLPDVENILSTLSKQTRLGLMTGSKKRFVNAIDTRLGFSLVFQATVTQDDTGIVHMKPDPYGLLLAAKQLGVQPEECLYIGDQLVDVQAARAAGMQSCLISGDHTQAGIESEADYSLQSIKELPSIV